MNKKMEGLIALLFFLLDYLAVMGLFVIVGYQVSKGD